MREIGDWLPGEQQATEEQRKEMGTWPVFCVARETVDESFQRVQEWFEKHPEIARGRALTLPQEESNGQ
jgi:hypothetical protein